MALADHLEAPAPPPGQRSKVEILLAELDDSERDALSAMLADDRRSDGWISRVLRKEGHSLNPSTIRNYRERHQLQRFATRSTT